MSVTIYEIAERAGVSSSTVARVLRGNGTGSNRRGVATAKRILSLANEMGYRPNARARAFSKKRTYGIGLLYTDDRWIFEGVNTQVVNSAVRTLQRAGYHLVFTPIDSKGAWEDIVLGGQIDGGLTFQAMPPEVSGAVADRNLPLVLLGDSTPTGQPQVVVDDVTGAYKATKHLIDLGHSRVAWYVHDTVKQHSSVQERTEGYRTAMAEAGLEACELMHTPEDEATSQILDGNPRQTGVLCYSDLESSLLTNALWSRGVVAPRDISLVGFNDVFASKCMTPPLTVVGFDSSKIGELGANLVLQAIEKEGADSSSKVETVDAELIVRGTTGPPPPLHEHG